MTSKHNDTSQGLNTYPVGTAGYAISFSLPENLKKTNFKEYLNNPLVLTKLTERVYELMVQDMRYQAERVRNYD